MIMASCAGKVLRDGVHEERIPVRLSVDKTSSAVTKVAVEVFNAS